MHSDLCRYTGRASPSASTGESHALSTVIGSAILNTHSLMRQAGELSEQGALTVVMRHPNVEWVDVNPILKLRSDLSLVRSLLLAARLLNTTLSTSPNTVPSRTTTFTSSVLRHQPSFVTLCYCFNCHPAEYPIRHPVGRLEALRVAPPCLVLRGHARVVLQARRHPYPGSYERRPRPHQVWHPQYVLAVAYSSMHFSLGHARSPTSPA